MLEVPSGGIVVQSKTKFQILLILTASFYTPTSHSSIIDQINEARSITQSWMHKKKEGLLKRDLYAGQPERADYIISGIPNYVKEIDPRGIVFRHYIGSNMPIILKTMQLKTGITPYIILNPGFSREVYEDLTGIFLTYPTTPPERVGLPKNENADYIDFTLFEGTPVLEIEKEILIIPGRPDLPDWLKTKYFEFKKTGYADPHYIDVFKKTDSRGGANPTFMQINIKNYRMNGIKNDSLSLIKLNLKAGMIDISINQNQGLMII